MVRSVVVFVFVLTVAASVAIGQKTEISIATPENGAAVPWRSCVSGAVTDPKAHVLVIVHPMDSSDFWVEPPVGIENNGRWKVQIYIAKSIAGIYQGRSFQLRAIANPTRQLRETDTAPLSDWPEAEAISDLVEVRRDDKAPDHCSRPFPAVSGSTNNETPTSANTRGSVSDSEHPTRVGPVSLALGASYPAFSASANTVEPSIYSPRQGGSAISAILSGAQRYIDKAQYFVYGVALLLLFPLVRLHDRSADAAERIGAWIECGAAWVGKLGLTLVGTVCNLTTLMLPRGERAIEIAYGARGFDGRIRQWVLSLLVFPALFLASVMVLYAEARMIQISLGIIFSGEGSATSSAGAGLLFGNTISNETVSANSILVDIATSHQISIVNFAKIFVDRVVNSFDILWQEPLGFVAIGFAALQGVFGVVAFWGMSALDVVRLRPFSMFRQRPLLCLCFVVFNITLAAMAALRGYELSPTGASPWAPSIIAGLLSVALVLMMALCAHCAVECAGDVLAMIVVAALASGVMVGIAAALAVWSAIALTIFLGAAIPFLAFVLPAALIWLYLQCAALYGEWIRDWKASLRPASVYVLSFLLSAMTLIASGYLISKGMKI